VFNVCSGRATRILELVRMYKEISGVHAEIVTSRERLRKHDTPVIVGSFERLRLATGWSPTIPLKQTLSDVFSYWLHAEQSEAASSLNTP
jgi:GDP-4-dehydro-6-deoxy-D-mannose reductase